MEFRGCKFREWEEDEEYYANYDYEIISLHEKILLSSSSLSLLLFKRPTIMKIKNNEWGIEDEDEGWRLGILLRGVKISKMIEGL